MAELLEETKATSKYIREQGYHLVEVYECQWRRIKKTNPQVQQFLNSKFISPSSRSANTQVCRNVPRFQKYRNFKRRYRSTHANLC